MRKRIQHHTVTMDLPLSKKTKDEEIEQLRTQLLAATRAAASAEDSRNSVQDLIDCARGSALILRSLFEYGDSPAKHNTITEGLALALKITTDHADVAVFNCAGELSDSVRPDHLADILEAKAAKLREKAKSAEPGGAAR